MEKNGAVCANAQRQHEYCGYGETWRFAQHSQSDAHVLPQRIKFSSATRLRATSRFNFPTLALKFISIAKRFACFSVRLLMREPTRVQLFRALGQMKFEFVAHVVGNGLAT